MLLDSFEYVFKGEDAATFPSISGTSFSGTADAFSRTALCYWIFSASNRTFRDFYDCNFVKFSFQLEQCIMHFSVELFSIFFSGPETHSSPSLAFDFLIFFLLLFSLKN